MKKILLFILLLIIPIKVMAFSDNFIIDTDETLNFNFIVTDVYEDEDGIVFIEGIKIVIDDCIGISDKNGIVKIENVPIENSIIYIYDQNNNLLYEKNIEYGYGVEDKGFRYNSVSIEDEETIHINLGYNIDDIKAGDIRMDVHVNYDENMASISLVTRMLGSSDSNDIHLLVVTVFALFIGLFMFLIEKYIDKE